MTSMEITRHHLQDNERINMEQEADWVECMTLGWVSKNNVYHIYCHPLMTEQIEVLTIRERSPLFCRLGCILPRCRSFLVTVLAANNEEMWFIYDKPFGVPFLCWNRPAFKVYDHDETSIGSIQSVCNFWGIRMLIMDESGLPIYEIQGTMVTPGFCCEPICGSCFPLTFKILDLRKDGYELAKFKKNSMGCFTDWVMNADRYDLEIPSIISYHERVLLLVAIHEIDMMYFERKL